MTKRFPILDRNSFGLVNGRAPSERGDIARPVESLPWAVVEPWRERCLKVHDQTLERLAERGGLSPAEAWCHAHGSNPCARAAWDAMPTPDELRTWLRRLGGTPCTT